MKSHAIQLQKRDFAVLRALFESRTMTSAHIATLHFEGRQEAAKKRLQKLKAAGLVGERERRAYSPSILFLTSKALDVLEGEGVLAEYPQLGLRALERRSCVSEATLRHELQVMDVKAAFHSAIRLAVKFKIAEFSTWPMLYQFEAFRLGYNGAEVLVKPDGFIRIDQNEPGGGKSQHTFFLELDRSTETQEKLIARAGAYLDYYKSGGFAVRNGADRVDYKDHPFRVLMVFKTSERRNNCAERLLQNSPPILSLAWLTTYSEVSANPLGPIWMLPADYRKATRDTPIYSKRQAPTFAYRRDTKRERHVELNVKKRRLFDV